MLPVYNPFCYLFMDVMIHYCGEFYAFEMLCFGKKLDWFCFKH